MSYISTPHLWAIGLTVSITAVVGMLAIAALAPVNLYRKLRIAMLVLCLLVLCIYALFSFGGLFAMGSGASGAEFLFLLSPVLTPLVMLLCLLSVGWAALGMWTIFFTTYVYDWSLNSWPAHEILGVVKFEWPIPAIALILTIIAWRDKAHTRPTRS